MNKLHLPGRLWLASDIHLGPQTPQTNRAFLAFLSQAAHQADALLLGGDIFNAWVGDDIISTPPDWLAEVLNALQHTAQSIPVFICRGNRDFLMGHTLCLHLGATLLHEQTLLETSAGNVLFSHGDEYCTDDHSYQRFRYWVRKRWVQRIFLAFNLRQRQKWAGIARTRSMQSNQYKPPQIMDVNAQAVQEAFERSGATLMVHGHTHRAAIHTLTGRCGELRRVVMPDWDYDTPNHPRGGWLEISPEGAIALKSDNSGVS